MSELNDNSSSGAIDIVSRSSMSAVPAVPAESREDPQQSVSATLTEALLNAGIPEGMHSAHGLRRLLEQALLSPVADDWPADEYARRLLHLHASGLFFIPSGRKT